MITWPAPINRIAIQKQQSGPIRNASKSYHRDAFHMSLGDIYFKQGQLSEAEN